MLAEAVRVTTPLLIIVFETAGFKTSSCTSLQSTQRGRDRAEHFTNATRATRRPHHTAPSTSAHFAHTRSKPEKWRQRGLFLLTQSRRHNGRLQRAQRHRLARAPCHQGAGSANEHTRSAPALRGTFSPALSSTATHCLTERIVTQPSPCRGGWFMVYCCAC